MGLQFLLQSGDLVAKGLELIALGIVLFLQVGELALEVVGSGDRFLEADDGDLWRTGRALPAQRRGICGLS